MNCPKCNSPVELPQKFCSVCGENLQHSSTTSIHKTSPTVDIHPEELLVICPQCGKPTDSLKQATLFHKLLFLMIFTQWQTAKYTCCPECMRKNIAKRTAITLITGNFLWPFLVLPLHGYHLYKSYQPGHSKGILSLMYNR